MIDPLLVRFPESIRFPKFGPLEIDLGTPLDNIVTIDYVDYIPYYLDNHRPGNKGANSHIIKLTTAQDWDSDYPAKPACVLKMSKYFYTPNSEHARSELLYNEITALLKCAQTGLPNTMEVSAHGIAEIFGSDARLRSYRFYTMPFAEYSLSDYLMVRNPGFSERVDLCVEICDSLSRIWAEGYYHRDIKPDNILFTENGWVLSDLGLAIHRDQEEVTRDTDLWIGPRGWMSPEAMNRFLCTNRPWFDLFNTEIDHQSDIFQLGQIFWYIFQGNSPTGGIRRKDFKIAHEAIYRVVRTMLNHNKKSRTKEIKSVANELKEISLKCLKHGEPAVWY